MGTGIQEIDESALINCPSAFNTQTMRIIILLKSTTRSCGILRKMGWSQLCRQRCLNAETTAN